MLDKRDHIAGNCFDYTNEVGIRVSKYGAHLFHTKVNHLCALFVSQLSNREGETSFTPRYGSVLTQGGMGTRVQPISSDIIHKCRGGGDTFSTPVQSSWVLDVWGSAASRPCDPREARIWFTSQWDCCMLGFCSSVRSIIIRMPKNTFALVYCDRA